MSFVVDVDVWDRVKAKAKRRGVSVTRYVTDLIVDDLEVKVQPPTAISPRPAVPARTPDWDAIFAAGLAEKSGAVGDDGCDAASHPDPLEEIA